MATQRGRVIKAATDGACSGNPGPGGWGGLIRFEDGSVEEFGGFEESTTNNRMELKAALETLQKLKNHSLHPNLSIWTDSKYLINGFSEWIKNWKQKNWRTASGKPVLNRDLWEALDKAKLDGVHLKYVKGHSGDIDNERVDKIAVSFSKKINIQLNTSHKKNIKKASKQLKPSEHQVKDSVPTNLNKLLSRLEIAHQIASHGYRVTHKEVAELANQPINEIKQKKEAWEWRDWIVHPVNNEYWKLYSKDDDL